MRNQAWAHRAPVMELVFQSVFGKKRINGLEIGAWYGIGSTKIWLKNCAPKSHFLIVDSWRPFASTDDLRDDDEASHYKAMDFLSTDAFLSTYLETKKVEEERLSEGIEISLVRTASTTFFHNLADESFDFIYIDGDHKYDAVKRDIVQAKRLISRRYGLICGDDLERIPTKELYDIAIQFPKRDFLRGDNQNFHPGVLAAVFEEFDQVNMMNGFWWIAFIDGQPNANAFAIQM
jgi:hypothetical protein